VPIFFRPDRLVGELMVASAAAVMPASDPGELRVEHGFGAVRLALVRVSPMHRKHSGPRRVPVNLAIG